jgi:hypothetical protein
MTTGQPKDGETSAKDEDGIDWNNPPQPGELGEDWEDVSDPRQKENSSRTTYQNKNSGNKIEFDKGKPGEPRWRGKDHWHRLNPNRSNKLDKYLDREGNPVPNGSEASHLKPGTNVVLPPLAPKGKVKVDTRNWFERAVDGVKEWLKPDTRTDYEKQQPEVQA